MYVIEKIKTVTNRKPTVLSGQKTVKAKNYAETDQTKLKSVRKVQNNSFHIYFSSHRRVEFVTVSISKFAII